MTRTVSVAQLKAQLSEFLAAVRGGAEVVITQRGRPVARLGPLGGSVGEQGRLAELVRAGLVRAPLTPLDAGSFLASPRPVDAAGRSLEAVLEERADGW